MTAPVHVTFKGLAARPDIDALIHEGVADLARHYAHFIETRVRVEVPHRHHASGNDVEVLIELVVPHERLVVTHTAKAHDDGARGEATLGRAVRDAFDVAERVVADYAARQRDHLRSRAATLPMHGR